MYKSIIKDVLDRFGNRILSIIILKEESDKLLIIFNDINYPKLREDITKFLEGKKKFNLLGLSELWGLAIDGRTQVINSIINSTVLYDIGLIKLLSYIEKFRKNLISKFEKYVVSIILFGSWSRGTQRKDSDIDVAVIMDDTDLKEMTRVEAKQKLREITFEISKEISERMIVQVYLLTEFWEMVRDANPIIFTLLRDGVPFYDKGLFVPWKILLKMGKIKPTPEAIESFISSGRLLRNSIDSSLKEIASEKLYYMMLNPAQAALMFIGISPSTPNETPLLLERYFVKKKLLKRKYVNWLNKIIKLRKDIEHNKIKDIYPRDLEKYFRWATEFSIKIEELFEKIRKEKMKDEVLEVEMFYKEKLRDMLEKIGIKVSGKRLNLSFIRNAVKKNLLPREYLEFTSYVYALKENYRRGKITDDEIRKVKTDIKDFASKISTMYELKKFGKSGKCRLKFKYGEKMGELWMLGDNAYIIKDLKNPEEIIKAKLTKDGNLSKIKNSSLEELNEERKNFDASGEIEIKEKTIECLKSILGCDIKIVLLE
ncbi:MAG: nucleotidyltransferase domain-containing protein [Candidatus Parvarchaeota archaeon]|nr:nucleotidyltransferase domain-containing protein [Candidatus Jingweiarchaeum tengchongense]MCW1298220.1 nucleotidyltransferase domain-containing protein [Candidatus Jingweiarchaeum tengchongense]MCW1300018.1 nucleotidyltransferase domain-containing protein [Candidatus Jingweiarchaeum tengchongense]MCW1304843.1 nucleotidyltransferase domain-containing protein [Candidatus Jingweiarchaeum tengchongense]MCW1305433.1 nucleotidyltransferase domain-containing protein [Candidatus Jingweiarchaeum ten